MKQFHIFAVCSCVTVFRRLLSLIIIIIIIIIIIDTFIKRHKCIGYRGAEKSVES